MDSLATLRGAAQMKAFNLICNEDVAGISGTGIVAHGVVFTNGKCALCWTTQHSSIAIYDSLADLIAIHGHNGKSEVRYINIFSEEMEISTYTPHPDASLI